MSDDVERVMGLAKDWNAKTELWARDDETSERVDAAAAALRAEVERIVQMKDALLRQAANAMEDAQIEAEQRAERENAALRRVLDRVHIRQEGEDSALERAEREVGMMARAADTEKAERQRAERERDEALALLRAHDESISAGDIINVVGGMLAHQRHELLARIDALTGRKG